MAACPQVLGLILSIKTSYLEIFDEGRSVYLPGREVNSSYLRSLGLVPQKYLKENLPWDVDFAQRIKALATKPINDLSLTPETFMIWKELISASCPQTSIHA